MPCCKVDDGMNHRGTEDAELFERFAAFLRERDAEPRPPASAQQIAAAERRLATRIPSQLRTYWSVFDGTGQDCFDTDFCSFWSVDEVGFAFDSTSQADELLDHPEEWIIIGDHSIGVTYFGLRLSTCEVVVFCPGYSSGPASLGARHSSLSAFVDAYMLHPLGAAL
ncbi:MAG: SMI1/KNR4 family protein [Planctomycetota bacterium]